MKVSARSKKEMQSAFIEQINQIISYWANLTAASDKEKCEGVARAIMNILDGTSGGFPCAISLVLNPHPDDKQYYIGNGEEYIESGMTINDNLLLNEMFTKNKNVTF